LPDVNCGGSCDEFNDKPEVDGVVLAGVDGSAVDGTILLVIYSIWQQIHSLFSFLFLGLYDFSLITVLF